MYNVLPDISLIYLPAAKRGSIYIGKGVFSNRFYICFILSDTLCFALFIEINILGAVCTLKYWALFDSLSPGPLSRDVKFVLSMHCELHWSCILCIKFGMILHGLFYLSLKLR